MSSFRLTDRNAVLTGAAGGIGRATALALAQRGCHLALVDVDAAGLAETAAQASALQPGLRISQHRLDVADRAAVAALPSEVSGHHGGVQLLINNAGVAAGGEFEQISEVDFDWLFEINFHGLVRMTRAFLPLLRQAEAAQIVNLSSVYGLISPPGQTAYSASKFAVRGFSNALRHELLGSTVGVTVVHPGGVATAIARNSRKPASVAPEDITRRVAEMERKLRLPPARAADIIVHGIEQRRARVLVGADARMIALLEWLRPVHHWRWIGPLMARS